MARLPTDIRPGPGELSTPTLRQRTPRVFHFLGHGDEDYLWFEDEQGSGDKVTAARLRRLFGGTPIRLALLNACWSATPRVKNLCVHLVEGAGLTAAIGHGNSVADASAIAFARGFYAEITRGQSIKQAYFAARNAMAEKGLPGASEIDLTGDGDSPLDEGLSPGDRPGRVEDGMPTRGYLPGADFFCGREGEFLQVARTLADPNSAALASGASAASARPPWPRRPPNATDGTSVMAALSLSTVARSRLRPPLSFSGELSPALTLQRGMTTLCSS